MLAGEVGSYAVVGGVGYVVDVAVFNVLAYQLPADVALSPLSARTVALVVAAAVTWVGNRYWTFRHARTDRAGREALRFLAASAAGALVVLGCLAFSREVLGLTSQLADNVSTNVVGFVLSTVVRFVLYRQLVFTDRT